MYNLRKILCLLISLHLFVNVSESFQMFQSNHLQVIREHIPMLENKTLIVCVVVREPFVIYQKTSDGLSMEEKGRLEADLDNYSGVAIEVLKQLSIIFKFRVRIIKPRDGHFGVFIPDRGWTGLVGSLVRNESDIGVTALSMTVTRSRVVDFTRAYYVETAAIMLRIPEEIQNYLAILEPFSVEVWILLIATILLLIFLITIMTELEQRQREQRKIHKLAKFVVDNRKLSTADQSTIPEEVRRHYWSQMEHKLDAIQVARSVREFGSTWLDRFYYATSCVINILLIRGK